MNGRALCVVALGVLVVGSAVSAHASHRPVEAPPLPGAVAEVLPKLAPQGGGEVAFFGMAIYDGWYWAAAHRWSLDTPFALDLHYHRKLSGASIAEHSASALEGLGDASDADIGRWRKAMTEIFPDVAKGDRITGVFLPPGTVRYYFNGRFIGEIVDARFARAFFGIWFDPRTKRPDFRRTLLGAP